MPEDCKSHETVVFFDEIQKCPEIVTKIKFLVDEGIIFNHYHPGDVMEDDNIFMCEYMTGLPTLAKVQDGDTELKMDVEALAGLYE